MSDQKRSFENGRTHPRFSQRFMIRSRRQGTDGLAWEDVSTVKDLSVGGCAFSSQWEYRPGEILELQISLPSMRDLLLVAGEVKRSEKMGSTKFFLIAVSFINLDAGTASELARMAHFFLGLQQGESS